MELLVVIIIIMVLAGISVAAFGSMVRGRSLGRAANLVRATVLRAQNYANQYNVRTRVNFQLENVGNGQEHYMIMEWYDTSATTPAWATVGQRRSYLPNGVTFSPLPGVDQGPVARLSVPIEGVVGIDPDPLANITASELRFDPDGSLSYWDDGLGNSILGADNVQIGMMNPGDGETEWKAVIVLHASGLAYIQEAYTP
jgi:type II secretory pathway pseudopilin PulG